MIGVAYTLPGPTTVHIGAPHQAGIHQHPSPFPLRVMRLANHDRAVVGA